MKTPKLVAIGCTLFASSPAAASFTSDQLIDQCRPQLQTFIQESLNERPPEGTRPEDDPEGTAKRAREEASLRANGINDPLIRDLVDHVRTESVSQSKAAIRKDLSDMKREIRGITDGRGQGPDVAIYIVGQCVMEAILADLEGRSPKAGASPATSQSASAAAVAARNKTAAEAAAGTAVPPLRKTASLEAHNPANEASQCLELITRKDFERRRIKSNMGAVFSNRCSYPIETRWCIGADRCSHGYDNLATMPASKYRSISYDAPAGVKTETRWAGCRLGFAHRSDFAGTLHYACK